MTRFLQFIERKPLGLSLLSLVVSLPLLGAVAVPSQRGPGVQAGLEWQLIVVFCLALALGLLGLVGVIRAERRGCSSTRIGLSITALFFAFLPIVFFAIKLVAVYRSS